MRRQHHATAEWADEQGERSCKTNTPFAMGGPRWITKLSQSHAGQSRRKSE